MFIYFAVFARLYIYEEMLFTIKTIIRPDCYEPRFVFLMVEVNEIERVFEDAAAKFAAN